MVLLNTDKIKEKFPWKKFKTNLSQWKLLSSIYTINKITCSLEKWEVHNEASVLNRCSSQNISAELKKKIVEENIQLIFD